MKAIYEMILTRPARKSGGDRYETGDGMIVFYLPQEHSRESGKPIEKIKLTIESMEE